MLDEFNAVAVDVLDEGNPDAGVGHLDRPVLDQVVVEPFQGGVEVVDRERRVDEVTGIERATLARRSPVGK